MNHKTRNKLILLAVVFLAVSCNKLPQSTYTGRTAIINGHKLNIEIAESAQQQRQGLSGRDMLAANSGMYFEFAEPGRYDFWMKDMKFPIDMIWIKGGEIVEITPHVPIEPGIEDDRLKRYSPRVPADAVLEVNSNWAARNGVKVGDSLIVD